MKEQLIQILETLGYPVFLQGSLNPNEAVPESFFTFWNFSTPEQGFYSNQPTAAEWGFWVYFYSTDPEKVETVTEQARQAFSSNVLDWTVSGKANDISSQRQPYTGAMFTVYYYEKYN